MTFLAGLMRGLLSATLVAVTLLLNACATGDSVTEATERHRKRVAAIESAELVILETHPHRYGLRITSGLPSGCAESGDIDLEYRGQTIVVTWNTMPADEGIACTMIYSTTTSVVELSEELEAGRTYRVRVNEEAAIRFTAR